MSMIKIKRFICKQCFPNYCELKYKYDTETDVCQPYDNSCAITKDGYAIWNIKRKPCKGGKK